MLAIRKIIIVARFEIKTLFRSWFFRIFSALALTILVIFDIAMLTEVSGGDWLYKGIPANIPYANLFMLNIAQAIIAVFLATEFLKSDHKLDTTEVVYMRSMTNGDYIIGKTIGILIVFFFLNLLILLVAGIMNIFSKEVTVDIISYLIYPALFSLPSLVFILGLSYVLMILIRNQAVTIIVLLGYIATILFYLAKKFYFLFDYMAFSFPLMRSDFIDFGNLTQVLLQRGIYLSLGCGFIFLTILLFKRLPQSKPMNYISTIAVILLFGGAGLLADSYLSPIFEGKRLREDMISLNNKLISDPHLSMISCDLDLIHEGEIIRTVARLRFRNNTEKEISTYVFTLNPGLEIEEIERSGESLAYQRELHTVLVEPERTLAAESEDSLTIRYKGRINEEASYIYVDESLRANELRLDMLNVDRRYSFLTPDYALLTREAMWYPEAGVNYCSTRPGYHRREFVNYSLSVTTRERLQAFSQGLENKVSEGKFHFRPETPLPQISLVIGDFYRRSVTIDSVEYNLITLKGHDYFESYMNEITDTLPALVHELKQDFEREIELPYVFPRFSLVEVPIQFTSYPRLWTMSQETVQPEMVFLPENGIPIWQANFKRSLERQKKQAERNNQVISDKEIQAQLFGQFIRAIITTGNQRTWFYSENIGYGRSAYSVYPNYYYYVYFLKSDDCPIVNMALESFLDKGAEGSTDIWRRNWQGLSDEEKANLALQKQSFNDLLGDVENDEVIYYVIRLKGFYLFTLLESKTTAQNFRKSLLSVLDQNRFKLLDIKELGDILREEYSLEVEPHVDHWFNSDQLPGFLIGGLTSYEFIDGDRTRYQVKFKASNPESVEGMFLMNFRTGEEGSTYGKDNARGSDDDNQKIIYLEPGQAKEVGVVLDAPPRSMTINSVISKNIPSILEYNFSELEVVRRVEPFDGERMLDAGFSFADPDEIIVDNEDADFELIQASTDSYLKKLIKEKSKKEEQKYAGIRWWRPPMNWQSITQSGFFGKYIRSAVYTKAGSGENKAIWKTAISDEGFYDVYCHIADATGGMYNDNSQQNNKYHFQVYHDDGIEDAVLELQNAEDGWNFLGTYYLSSDSAKVQVTNDSEGRMVIADAVKWVKQ